MPLGSTATKSKQNFFHERSTVVYDLSTVRHELWRLRLATEYEQHPWSGYRRLIAKLHHLLQRHAPLQAGHAQRVKARSRSLKSMASIDPIWCRCAFISALQRKYGCRPQARILEKQNWFADESSFFCMRLCLSSAISGFLRWTWGD